MVEPLFKQKSMNIISKKNILPIALLLLVTGFIGLLFTNSSKKETLLELEQCENINAVKLFVQDHSDLVKKDPKFSLAVRDKLNTFNLSQPEIDSTLLWLPNTPKHLNLIILPDLSNRLKTPEKVDGDLNLLKEIWDAFVRYSKRRAKSNDRLSVVIDQKQTSLNFEDIADKLNTDLTTIGSKINREYFTSYRKSKFVKNVKKLYEAELLNQELNLSNVLHQEIHQLYLTNTLYDQYENKLIIISSGLPDKNDSFIVKNTEIADIYPSYTLSVFICGLDNHLQQKKSKIWEEIMKQNHVYPQTTEYVGYSALLEPISKKIHTFIERN